VQAEIPREKGKVTLSTDASVPILVLSLFTAKGEAFADQSIYRIMYSFLLNGDNSELPKITFKGLLYVGRLPAGADGQGTLDRIWRERVVTK
jgi:hypothetical protein